MKKLSYSFPILNRIFLKTFKSIFFISLTATFLFLFILSNIIISATANKGNHFDTSSILIYVFNFAILLIYFAILQMWYIAKFKIEDKKSGIFSLELRNGFGAKSIFWQRLLPIFLITTAFFILCNLIMLIILVCSKSILLNSMASNLFLGMFIILFINYLIGAILIFISNWNSILFLGIIGSLIMIFFSFNFLWTMLSSLNSKLYDNSLAFTTARYQILYKTKQLEENQKDNFDQLFNGFNELQNHKVKDTWKGLACNNDEYKNNCLKNGVSVFAFEEDQTDQNYYLDFLSTLNNNFLSDKDITSKSIDSIWNKTYFDMYNQESYNFDGEFNFNSLIKYINTTNDQFLIDLSMIINDVVQNIFTLETYLYYSSQNGQNIQIMYSSGNGNRWIEENKQSINPAIRLYEMGLEFLISNRLNVEKMEIYDFDEKNSNISSGQYYKKNMSKVIYLNPFLAFQSVFFYDSFKIDSYIDQKLSYESKMWVMPILNLYDVRMSDTNNTDYFKTLEESNLVAIQKMRGYFNPIFIYMILSIVISILMLISYILFKKSMYIS